MSFADTLPLSNEIISTIQNRKVLYVAALLHDIGKGRKEDHSIVGARNRSATLSPPRAVTRVKLTRSSGLCASI